jgi:hypothetical protein
LKIFLLSIACHKAEGRIGKEVVRGMGSEEE